MKWLNSSNDFVWGPSFFSQIWFVFQLFSLEIWAHRWPTFALLNRCKFFFHSLTFCKFSTGRHVGSFCLLLLGMYARPKVREKKYDKSIVIVHLTSKRNLVASVYDHDSILNICQTSNIALIDVSVPYDQQMTEWSQIDFDETQKLVYLERNIGNK